MTRTIVSDSHINVYYHQFPSKKCHQNLTIGDHFAVLIDVMYPHRHSVLTLGGWGECARNASFASRWHRSEASTDLLPAASFTHSIDAIPRVTRQTDSEHDAYLDSSFAHPRDTRSSSPI